MTRNFHTLQTVADGDEATTQTWYLCQTVVQTSVRKWFWIQSQTLNIDLLGLVIDVVAPQSVPFHRHFNLKKANWEIFTADLDASIKDLPSSTDNYNAFVDLVKSSFQKNIPRGCRTNYISGLSDDAKESYNDYTICFQNDPFGNDTLETGEKLINATSEGRINKWQELIESFLLLDSQEQKSLENHKDAQKRLYKTLTEVWSHSRPRCQWAPFEWSRELRLSPQQG